MRDAVSEYLLTEIGSQYLKGELFIPTLMMVHETDSCVWGDFWIYWYNIWGDTLKTVSGGNHAGKMSLSYEDGKPYVVSFEQTVDGAGNDESARRIFGTHYDIYQNMHSNEDVREAVRQEQTAETIRRNKLHFRYYQDYGHPAVELYGVEP